MEVNRRGYALSRQRPVADPYQAILLSFMSSLSRLRMVQIGANDGMTADPMYNFVKRFPDKTELVLIEPQSVLIPYLKENYAFHPRAVIENCAIGPDGHLQLFAIKEQYWNKLKIVPYAINWPHYRAPTGVASSNRDHVERFLTKYLMPEYDINDVIEELTVPCHVLEEICRQAGLEGPIDVLQVDAEGCDDEVIYNSSIEMLQPRVICFETVNLSLERLEALRSYLASHGYEIIPNGLDALALHTCC